MTICCYVFFALIIPYEQGIEQPFKVEGQRCHEAEHYLAASFLTFFKRKNSSYQHVVL